MRKFGIKIMKNISFLVLLFFVVFSLESVYAQTILGSHLYDKVADSATFNDYLHIFGTNQDGGRYAGRVWTDKSVHATNLEEIDRIHNANITLDSSKNEEFLISFSALGSSRSVKSADTIPIDLILVLDTSTSMSLSSMNELTEQTNSLIEQLMHINKNNRIGIVTFAGGSEVLLELDHYEPVGSHYISMQRHTGDGTTKYFNRLNADVINSKGERLQKTGKYFFADSTYLQGGIYDGMKMLADESVTTYVPVSGQVEKRVPVMIVMSDGGTNVSTALKTGDGSNSKSYEWWQGVTGTMDTITTGKKVYTDYIPKPNDNPIYTSLITSNNYKEAIAGRTLTTLMNASYMKKAVERNYDREMLNYSVAYNLANVTNIQEMEQLLGTLNPREYFREDASLADGTCFSQLRLAYTTWKRYLNGEEPSLYFRLQNLNNGVVEDVSWMGQVLQATWQFRHVDRSSGDHYYTEDFESLDDLYYVDEFYEAESSKVGEIFNKIVSKIEAVSFPPIIDSVGTSRKLGIVYEDPIGEYMQVKDVKMLTLFGKAYTPVQKESIGNKTVYTFESTNLSHPAYGGKVKVDLSHIGVEVLKENGRETLSILIPEDTLPLRSDIITLDSSFNILSYDKNQVEDAALPLRVFYSVGISDDIKVDTDFDGVVDTIDLTKIRRDYVKQNVDSEHTLSLYSNLYRNSIRSDLEFKTAGDATATFKPSKQNRYYYFQKNRIIYSNPNGKEGVTLDGSDQPGLGYQKVTNLSHIKDQEKYYLVIDFYRETTPGKGEYVNYVVERMGSELKGSLTYFNPLTNEVSNQAREGFVLATDVGSVRLGRLHRFASEKKDFNHTDTANYAYLPTYLDASSSSQTVRVYLGNNGRIKLAGGNLVIKNRVLSTDKSEWNFKVIWKDQEGKPITGEYIYSGQRHGKVQSGDSIALKTGEDVTIYNLPGATSYEVIMEVDEDTTQVVATGDVGQIQVGDQAVAIFKNYVEVDTVLEQDRGGQIENPTTLDDSHPIFWIVISLCSFLGMGLTYFLYRREIQR